MRPLLLAACLATVLASSLAAQRLGPPVERPRLRDVTDTTDAQAYYEHGLPQFERNPKEAAAAFYWAARINPAWGEALHARRAAMIMSDKSLLARVFERTRRTTNSPELRRLDSLQFRALLLNPVLYRRFDRTMFTTYIRESVMHRSRMQGGDPSPVELDYAIDSWLRDAGPYMQGWRSYADGNFPRALQYYASALGRSRDKAGIHLERARIFGMLAQTDSAIAAFDLALAELRTQDKDDLVVFYDSKAQAEYSKAVLLEGEGNVDAARAGYAQALQEDLAYYPAHTRMGLLALGRADTATATSELALAAQIAPDEPNVRYLNGFVLGVVKQYPAAIEELKKAVELEPYFALPYLRLGQLYETTGKGPEALAAYEGFLSRASQNDPQREYAAGRATEVKEILSVVITP